MRGRKPLLWLALATAMVAPGKAAARTKTYSSTTDGTPPQKQPRRRADRVAQRVAPLASPCGRHVVEVANGAVYIDGRRVHPGGGTVHLLSAPVWRRDGGAVAWLERRAGETRLMVLPTVARDAEPLPWTLPRLPSGDQVFWAGRNRVVVGPHVLQPRAVASWTP